MSTSSGATVTNRQSIADVFADCYSQLYQRLDHDQPTAPPATTRKTTDDAIPPFTLKELNSTIAQLRSGRCRDTTGLLAEMLKQGGNTLRGHLLQLYNDILQPNAQPPASWRQSTISIIFKSGDPQLPNNYRPISIIPLLYKLFARLLYNRIEPQLDKHQTPDQAGFRHDYSTDDHLYTTTLIHERSHEWQLPLWVSAVDFKKAFDTIDHKCLWQALARQNLPSNYIHLLQKLYDDLTAVVKTDKQSRRFSIERGVKQGDPLSSLLFNALLGDIFQQLKIQWCRRSYGIQLGHTHATRLTNLRFADDVLLFARTLPQLTTMLTHLRDLAKTYGLELHPDKTYILSNLHRRRGSQATPKVDIGGQYVNVLHHKECAKYLGRKFTLDDYHTTEIDNQISTTWRKLNAMRNEQTNRRYPLRARLHMFDATITPTILYGCASWTTTTDLTTKILRTQRRMLRLIIGTPRRRTATLPRTTDTSSSQDHDRAPQHNDDDDLEPWPQYIKRATATAEKIANNLRIPAWDTTFWRRKWRWATRIANQPRNRWTYLSTTWQPELDPHQPSHRRQARPKKRWDDDIRSFVQNKSTPPNTSNWMDLARDSTTWMRLESEFIQYAMSRKAKVKKPEEGKDEETQ